MKAAVFHRYGPPEVIQIAEVHTPTPGEDEVLVKTNATAVSSGECAMRGFNSVPWLFWLPMRLILGVRRPRNPRLGAEFAGVVAAVGTGVTAFAPGDRVFGSTAMKAAAHAEYLCIPASGALAITPDRLSDPEAAAIPFGAFTALTFLRLGGIESIPAARVLIWGAAGAVGSAAVQLAKHYGAHVTGVCSTTKLERVHSLGADRVVDYTSQDQSALAGPFDIVFDTVGATRYAQVKPWLSPAGRYLNTRFGLGKLLQMVWTGCFSKRRVVCTVSGENAADLAFLRGLIEAGTLRPVIDRRYRLDDLVEAHRYVDSGRKVGAVVIQIAEAG